MYKIEHAENTGDLIITGCHGDCILIRTQDLPKFLDELCENDLVNECSKYAKLLEKNERLQEDLEMTESLIASVILSRLEKEIEKVEKHQLYDPIERAAIIYHLDNIRQAIAYQKISET